MRDSFDILKDLINKAASDNHTASAEYFFYVDNVRNCLSCEFNGGLSFLHLTVDNQCTELTTSLALSLLDKSHA